MPFSAFHLDHIVARQHGGTDEQKNLAWSCQECNLLKGTDLSAVDPDKFRSLLLESRVWHELLPEKALDISAGCLQTQGNGGPMNRHQATGQATPPSGTPRRSGQG